MEFIMEHVCKRFDDKEVLTGAGYAFDEGKIYGLLGRNGAGKTTLFNCINQDILPEEGNFLLREEAEPRPIMQNEIGYVISTPTVPEFLTGREFLKFFTDINRESIPHPMPIDAYFDMVHIEQNDRDLLMKDYSHGMKNKMQMLVNLIAQPKLLLLDEPLTSLDVVVSEQMKEILRRMKEHRVTILSTHILDLALDLCDEIVLLNHGVLEALPTEHLGREEFRAKIIEALQEETK